MTYDLTGRSAIITGASQGLGLAIARAYVTAGASVLICARDAAALAVARQELVQLASAQDYAPGQPAEGIVIRPVEEARSRILESGRLSAKVISERYALKHGE